MGQPVFSDKSCTVEEYFALSTNSDHRLEFEHGEVINMGRTTDTHEDLAFNLKQALRNATKGKNCRVHKESVALEVEADGKYYLPDVMLTCDPRDHEDRQIKRYPGLVAEVVSGGSVKRDRDVKFRAYLKLPTLHYYLLIAQDQVRIEVFSKMENKGWMFDYFESVEDIIPLPKPGIDLSVSDVYDQVELITEPEDEN